MHISVPISRDVLSSRTPLLYKYYVHAEANKKWEWLPKEAYYQNGYTNRELIIPVEFVKQNGNNGVEIFLALSFSTAFLLAV